MQNKIIKSTIQKAMQECIAFFAYYPKYIIEKGWKNNYFDENLYNIFIFVF